MGIVLAEDVGVASQGCDCRRNIGVAVGEAGPSAVGVAVGVASYLFRDRGSRDVDHR